MKNRRRYGRKVKHTRTNLYRRKKTRGQKALGTALLVIAVFAAAFLGYCVGKPLLEFIDKSAEREEPEWVPPASVTSEAEKTPETATEAAAQTSEEAEEAPPSAERKIRAITAPSTALQNTSSLSAFAAHAKENGYNAVVLPLKDENGYFHYASSAAYAEALIKSPLTAEEIAGVFSDCEMTAIGSVSVLSDDAGCNFNMDMCYKIVNEVNTSWLDFDYDPPIFWADPAKEATAAYFNGIADELEAAGITVMPKELVFPALDEYDRRYIAAPYFEESRSAMLLPFARENSPVEMLAEDIIAESPGRTAELLREKEFAENGFIAVRIRRSSFSPEDGWPASAAGFIEDILSRVRLKIGHTALIPVIESADYSEAELEAVKSLLLDTGYIVD